MTRILATADFVVGNCAREMSLRDEKSAYDAVHNNTRRGGGFFGRGRSVVLDFCIILLAVQKVNLIVWRGGESWVLSILSRWMIL